MNLFILSFLFVFLSSYFITSMVTPKKDSVGFLYLGLSFFALNVGLFEFLSLFKLINRNNTFIGDIILFFITFSLWYKYSKKTWKPDFKKAFLSLKNILKLDKSLILLSVIFIAYILVAITLCTVYPIVNNDAIDYHAARCLYWIQAGTIQQFNYVPDIRMLCLPINSEIIYTWLLLFFKTDFGFGFVSFGGYLLSIISIWTIMGLLGFCKRKILWTIFIVSSFASVMLQMSGTETDIIISGLVLSALTLFLYGIKNFEDENYQKNETFVPIFFSALAYALAIGTKTTAFFTIPASAIFMLILCKKHVKTNFWKPFLYFFGFGILNFMLFASYNYILNIINYHALSGPKNFVIVSRNFYGIKGMVYNFIRNCSRLIDTSGFTWGKYLQNYLASACNGLTTFFHVNNVNEGIYSISKNYMNETLVEPITGAGLLATLCFLPSLIWSYLKALKDKLIVKRVQNQTKIYIGFATIFIINLLAMSFLISYMIYNIRFTSCFIVISSPILALTYFRKSNILKPIIIAIAIFYYAVIGTHLWARPFFKMLKVLPNTSISQFQNLRSCEDQYIENPASICTLKNFITKNLSKKSKILVFPNDNSGIFLLNKLNLHGYHIYSGNLETMNEIDFDKYEYIALPIQQSLTVINEEKRHRNCNLKGNKVFCTSKEGVQCLYLNNNKIPKEYQEAYSAICVITKTEVKKLGLEYIGYAAPLAYTEGMDKKRQEEIRNNATNHTYIIYKNPNYKSE